MKTKVLRKLKYCVMRFVETRDKLTLALFDTRHVKSGEVDANLICEKGKPEIVQLVYILIICRLQ